MTISIALAAFAAAQAAVPQAVPTAEPQVAQPAAPQAPQPIAPEAAQTGAPVANEVAAPQAVRAPWLAPLPPAPASTAPAGVAANPATQAGTPVTGSPNGPILWRNIASGMSVAQLRALYPQAPNVHYKNDRTVLSDVPIIEGCEAKVNIMHPTGAVKEIVMRGEGAIAGRCSLKLITALSGKYGESLEKDKVRGSLFARQGKNYVWTRDGVTLQFKRYTSGALGGGGLFAASWELRYSANASNIDL